MNLVDIAKSARLNAKEHSPVILSVTAGIGVLSTAYLSAKAAYLSAEIIRLENKEYSDSKERLTEQFKLVWKLYIPAASSAAATIACIVGANRVEAKKTLAAQTAFAVSQKVYSDYREKVIEELGERKDESIRNKIAEDRVKESPSSKDVIVTGSGSVLCCELFTGRYFTSDMETLRKAQNDLNDRLLKHDYATFDDFYYMIGLPMTSASGRLGWRSSKLMELYFSTVLNDNGVPCLAFEYNYHDTL